MTAIVFVYAKGGPPLEHALPRIAACGDLHLLAVSPLPTAAHGIWSSVCASIRSVDGYARGATLVERIVDRCRAVKADALLCLSEYAVVAVAEAAQVLGLTGAGP